MTREVLTERVGELTDAVLADWRWVADDMNVGVLGMILYGLATATAEAMGLGEADVDAAVFRCITERVGAAAKWSGGLVEEAKASAHDEDYHPGQHELIGVGMTYYGVNNLEAVVNNVFANLASVRNAAGLPEPKVLVFLNPLVVLLAGAEQQKGSPLTEAEVLKIRDDAACVQMPLSQAEKFYAALDAQVPILRLDPERIWEQWQAVREEIE